MYVIIETTTNTKDSIHSTHSTPRCQTPPFDSCFITPMIRTPICGAACSGKRRIYVKGNLVLVDSGCSRVLCTNSKISIGSCLERKNKVSLLSRITHLYWQKSSLNHHAKVEIAFQASYMFFGAIQKVQAAATKSGSFHGCIGMAFMSILIISNWRCIPFHREYNSI